MNTPRRDDIPADEPQQRSWVETQLVPHIEAQGCLQGATNAPYVGDDWRPRVEFELEVERDGEIVVIKGRNRVKGVLFGGRDDEESFEVIVSPSGHISHGIYNTGDQSMFEKRVYAILFAAANIN